MSIPTNAKEETRDINGVEYVKINGVWKPASQVRKAPDKIKQRQQELAKNFKDIHSLLSKIVTQIPLGSEKSMEISAKLQQMQKSLRPVHHDIATLYREMRKNRR